RRDSISRRCGIPLTSTPRGGLSHEVLPRYREPQGHQLGRPGGLDRRDHHQPVAARQAGWRPGPAGRPERDLLARRGPRVRRGGRRGLGWDGARGQAARQDCGQHRRQDSDARGGHGSGAAARRRRHQDQCHAVLFERTVSRRGEGGGFVRESLHRPARRRGSGGDGRDPRGARHLRQLPDRHRNPGGLDPPSAPRGGSGDDRRGRRHPAPRRPEKAAAPPAHRPRAGAVPRGLEQARGACEGAGLTYSSPLSQRYASPAMQALWGERRRIGLWRRLWLALMEVERELGLDIPERALAELRAHLDDADLERAAEHEKRLRHDVMAHIHHLGEQAPAARPFLHLGATSAYVTDNTDLILMREGLQLLLGRIAAVLVALAKLARRERAVPCLAYTHFQPAQLTTVGKRVTLWMQEFLLDAEELLHRLDALQFRGVKGTTGTQASFLELFEGAQEKVRELDARVAGKMGFAQLFPVTGQTYTRKLDAQVLAALSGIAASCAKFATDVRLLQHEGEMLEPFESEQVGSSAMAYKRNPMRAERITSLARFVIELEGNAWHTAAAQWLERTLDDSANRRLVIPEAFLATDAILVLAINVAAGLEVREETITQHVTAAMPYLATERLLMRGVKAGGDRQQLHEVIRAQSLQGSQGLLDRLARTPEFKQLGVRATAEELDPAAYVGRAPQQVDEFLDRV